jgi:hypothetical protein
MDIHKTGAVELMPTRNPEAQLKYEILKFIATLTNVKLFNNPIGSGYCGKLVRHTGANVVLAWARRVTFGLFGAGGPDLIGWKTIIIRPEHVGQQLAVFCAVEVKRPGNLGRITPEQIDTIELINKSGGIAGVVNSIDQLKNIIGES